MKLNTFVYVLTLIFITLKLLGNIAWSWLWVLAPLWLPFVIAISVAALMIAVYGEKKAGEIIQKLKEKRL